MAETRVLRRDAKGEFPTFEVTAGSFQRVVMVLGKPSPSITIPGTRFAYNSAFPTPAIAGGLRFMIEAMDEAPNRKATVFGHADTTGSDQFNKNLSDRRAQATLALLADDPAGFDKVAKDEDWDSSIYQAMLRALGPNPGPIDGKPGELTKRAVRGFQREYAQGVYHRDSARTPSVSVVESGELDSVTKQAVRDAYIALFSTRIPLDSFAGPKFAGCSEFIPLSDSTKASDNRRVTFAVFRAALVPRDDEFPCVQGDASACPLDSGSGRRCPFYRERVQEPQEPEFAGDEIPFFDFQWLRGSDTVTHLSVITTLPDETTVTFRVLRVEKLLIDVQLPDCSREGSPPELGPELATVSGVVKNGIAFAKWVHAAEETPFDQTKWEVDLDFDLIGEEGPPAKVTSSELFDALSFCPPVFEVTSGEVWGLSAPPGQALNRVNLDAEGGQGLALTSSGFFIAFDAKQGVVPSDDRAFVVNVAASEAHVTREDGTI